LLGYVVSGGELAYHLVIWALFQLLLEWVLLKIAVDIEALSEIGVAGSLGGDTASVGVAILLFDGVDDAANEVLVGDLILCTVSCLPGCVVEARHGTLIIIVLPVLKHYMWRKSVR
jgi:hypothetical protein